MKVYFEHYRVHNTVECVRGKPTKGCLQRYFRSRPNSWIPRETGGATVCTISLDSGQEVTGTAFCSMGDAFCYRIGRKISYARAIAASLALLDAGATEPPKNKVTILFDKDDSVYVATALKAALQSSALTDATKAKLKEVYGRAIVSRPIPED